MILIYLNFNLNKNNGLQFILFINKISEFNLFFTMKKCLTHCHLYRAK